MVGTFMGLGPCDFSHPELASSLTKRTDPNQQPFGVHLATQLADLPL